MKRIIINTRQVDYINESAVNISSMADDNSISSFSKVATSPQTTSDVQKAKVGGDVNLTISGPDSSDDQPVQVVNVNKGQSVADAISDQGNDELIRNGSRLCITGDGIGESYVFTKKILKEARLAKIKREGYTLTKKELLESLLK